ncbi:MAG TPA: glycosyltransferase, partial [Acidimicrobiales bacterium]|nr:glycosyltransferase [Acidimicrobiales bacterium]
MHFVFGLEPQDAPFHLLHYLAIASCQRVLEPDEIRLHVHHLPYGIYWDLARPLVRLERIEPVAGVDAATPEELRPWIYARHADVVRLDVLDRHGGLYADIDTLFHAPVPAELWERPAVIGREDPVQYPDAPEPEPSVTNALVMARPGAPFIREWRERILGAMDGSWSGHSCRLATRLAA